MWKGRDEPWWSDIAPSALQFAYCRVTSRGDPCWCGGEAPLDPSHLWVTIEAPQGTAADLAPYSGVTDVHGVDIYPVTVAHPAPNLQQVGEVDGYARLDLAAATGVDDDPDLRGRQLRPRDRPVRPPDVPARALHGVRRDPQRSQVPHLLRRQQRELLQRERRPVRLELVLLAERPQAAHPAALGLEPHRAGARDTTRARRTSPRPARATEAILRQGTSVDDLWLIAARNGPGARYVRIKGLPRWAHSASVYTENRTVTASGGSCATASTSGTSTSTTSSSRCCCARRRPAGRRSTPASRCSGKGLAAVSAVTFGGAGRTVHGRRRREARGHRSRDARRADRSSSPRRSSRFESKAVVRDRPSPQTKPRIIGVPRLGHRLQVDDGHLVRGPGDELHVPLAGAATGSGRDCRPLRARREDAAARADRSWASGSACVVTAHTGLRLGQLPLGRDRASSRS